MFIGLRWKSLPIVNREGMGRGSLQSARRRRAATRHRRFPSGHRIPIVVRSGMYLGMPTSRGYKHPSPQSFAVYDNGVSQTRLPPWGEERNRRRQSYDAQGCLTFSGGGKAPKNMRFCETNRIVKLANRAVTYRYAIGCANGLENMNPVRLAKPNQFWRDYGKTNGDRRTTGGDGDVLSPSSEGGSFRWGGHDGAPKRIRGKRGSPTRETTKPACFFWGEFV
jgi:hypothetical protein